MSANTYSAGSAGGLTPLLELMRWLIVLLLAVVAGGVVSDALPDYAGAIGWIFGFTAAWILK